MNCEKLFIEVAKQKILEVEAREMPDGALFGNPANLICFDAGRSCGVWRDGRAVFPSKAAGEAALEEALSELFALIGSAGLENALKRGGLNARFRFGGSLGRRSNELLGILKEALEASDK